MSAIRDTLSDAGSVCKQGIRHLSLQTVTLYVLASSHKSRSASLLTQHASRANSPDVGTVVCKSVPLPGQPYICGWYTTFFQEGKKGEVEVEEHDIQYVQDTGMNWAVKDSLGIIWYEDCVCVIGIRVRSYFHFCLDRTS